MTDEYVCSDWCCQDCRILLANGDTPADLTEEGTAAWLAEIEARSAGYRITLGMPIEDHECRFNYTANVWVDGRPRFWVRWYRALRNRPDGTEVVQFRADDMPEALERIEDMEGPRALVRDIESHELQKVDDCECEHDSSPWSACGVCDSYPGGDRYAMSWWKIVA